MVDPAEVALIINGSQKEESVTCIVFMFRYLAILSVVTRSFVKNAASCDHLRSGIAEISILHSGDERRLQM